jgi:hypothetical protein
VNFRPFGEFFLGPVFTLQKLVSFEVGFVFCNFDQKWVGATFGAIFSQTHLAIW